MVYIIAFALSCFIASIMPKRVRLKGTHGRLNKTNLSLLCAMFPLYFITIFRDESVGYDYTNYLTTYYELGTEGRDWEKLFGLLINIARYIASPYIIIIVFGTVFCIITYKTIYEESDNVVLSIILLGVTGYFLTSLSAMRQMAALSIVVYSVKYLIHKNYKKWIVYCLVASLLHNTMVLWIPFTGVFILFIILLDKKPKLTKIMSVLVLAVLYINTSSLRGLSESLITGIRAFSFYKRYIGSAYDNGVTSGSLILYTVPVLMIFCLWTYPQKENEIFKRKYVIGYAASYTAAAFALLLPLFPNGERLVNIFQAVEILSVPFLYSYMKKIDLLNKSKRITKSYNQAVVLLIIISSLYATIQYVIMKNVYGVYPYKFLL